MTEQRKPTCPECGGHEFYECSLVLYKQRILRWRDQEPDEYAAGVNVSDDIYDTPEGPFSCVDCGAYDITLETLFPEES